MHDTTTELVTSEERSKHCADCNAEFNEIDDRRYKQCAACRKGSEPETSSESATAPTPTVHSPPPIENQVRPLHIDVDEDADDAPAKREYWCGVTADAPVHRAVLCGITFPRDHGILAKKTGKLQMVDHVQKGQIHRLTEKHVARILEDAGTKVVRQFGNGRGKVVTKKGSHSRPYLRRPGDQPLGKFIYMVELGGSMPRDWRETDPPTMVRR